jgi:catechol 2,3-dioxygenase-like lactoylglutathione lyase family enzyme
MFDHVTIRASDRAASEAFYDTVLATIGAQKTHSDDELAEWHEFSLAEATDERPPTRGLHIAFAAPTRELAVTFWRTGTATGYRDDGPPGPRPQYGPSYFGAFLLDPDGNSAEAVHDDRVAPRGGIDHLWIRVADVAASRAFYLAVAPFAGFEIRDDTPDRVQFVGGGRSFSVVSGSPTEHVHLAFPAAGDATVDAFHRELTADGYRDDGAPGERPEYHPGYYAAYVLDPDGNGVELVNHNRERGGPAQRAIRY